MKEKEQNSEVAGNSSEGIRADIAACAGIDAEDETQVQAFGFRPFTVAFEADMLGWNIERWVKQGADMKMVMAVLSIGFTKAFAGKGYALKLKTEKLF